LRGFSVVVVVVVRWPGKGLPATLFNDEDMKADILAFGAHPDDIEVACGGTLAAAVAEGKTVVAIDLTRGELGTRGCGHTRLEEAAQATQLLGLHGRENLQLEDAFFQVNEENIRKVITVIRRYRPEIILCNPEQDRHPDHAKASKLITEAAYLSGLTKIVTADDGIQQAHWRAAYVFHYIQHVFLEPDFILDISAHIEQKIQAILAYASQFNCAASQEEPETFISAPAFMDTIKSRASLLGRRAGVQCAEGFISAKTPAVKSFDAFIQKPT
jgi:N-acetylglucosamine malate deacetylase 1